MPPVPKGFRTTTLDAVPGETSQHYSGVVVELRTAGDLPASGHWNLSGLGSPGTLQVKSDAARYFGETSLLSDQKHRLRLRRLLRARRDLRNKLASTLELCACGKQEKAPERMAAEALQIKLVAGTGFEPVTFRL
jgi:hypothetical protein